MLCLTQRQDNSCSHQSKLSNRMENKWLIFTAMAAILVSHVRGDCWDTGCQLNSWAVTGCAQYGRVETGRKGCPNGNIFTCCTSGGGGNPPSSGGGSGGESGICSWYGAEGEIPQGHPTASGEGFDRFAMASAHKTLPFGTMVRVTSSATGKSVVVRINDRGPFVAGRILDLTYAAFGVIDDRNKGIVQCSYQIV